MKSRPLEDELFNADERMDDMTKLVVAFHKYVKSTKKLSY